MEQDVARLKEEKNQLSNLLQGQAKTVDALKEDVTLFQMQATELIDGIGDKSTEAENLKSEKERIKAEKDKLNKRCSELMNELEARKIEVGTYTYNNMTRCEKRDHNMLCMTISCGLHS